jgi:hypothetical protein
MHGTFLVIYRHVISSYTFAADHIMGLVTMLRNLLGIPVEDVPAPGFTLKALHFFRRPCNALPVETATRQHLWTCWIAPLCSHKPPDDSHAYGRGVRRS